VVADRSEVGFHQVGDDRGRLAEEEPIDKRAGADVVAGDDTDLLVAVLRLLVVHSLGQPRGATGELAVDVQAGAGLEVAVEVVPRQEMHVGGARLGGLELHRNTVSQRSRPVDRRSSHRCR